jgi:hypothetical protein
MNYTTNKRRAKGGQMTDAAREARRAYQREWRRRNPDKVKEYAARYWAQLAERKGQSQQQKSAENAKNEGGGVD